jgi:hypothetical protein
MDLTMLRTIVRRQRFHAYCQSAEQHGNTRLSSILRTLVPHVPVTPANAPPIPEEIERLYETHSDVVPPDIYNALLAYINENTMEPFHHCADLPHTNLRVLPQIAIKHKWITHLTRLFGPNSLNPGNSCVSFWTSSGVDRVVRSGEIIGIWSHLLDGIMREFLAVSPHLPLSEEDSARNPYNSFPGFRCTVVYKQLTNQIVIIEPIHLISHLAQLVRPPGTFGMSSSILILNHSLNCNHAL